jgi:hypothetical protein
LAQETETTEVVEVVAESSDGSQVVVTEEASATITSDVSATPTETPVANTDSQPTASDTSSSEAAVATPPEAATSAADPSPTPAPEPQTPVAPTATAAEAAQTPASETTPPTVDSFEEAVPGQEKANNGSAFRFSYPVRDNQSGEIMTPTAAPNGNDVPSSITPADLAQGEAISSTPIAPGIAAAADAPFETLGGAASPDIGEGVFSKSPFRYSFAVYEGYNSNVNTQPNNGVQSMYTEVAAGIGYEFGGSRLQLETSLGAALTYYYNNKNLSYDGLFPTVNFVLGANYEATPRLDLSFNTITTLQTQPNFTTSGGSDFYQGPYILSDTTLGAKYLWLPKLATETTYNPVLWYYLDPGAEATDFSRYEQTIGQQFIFLWKPQTSLVAEYRFNTRNYFYAKNYDSIGNYGLLGVDHVLNPRSTLTFRGGVEQRFMQNPDNVGTNDYFGPYGEFNFNYALNPDTTVAVQTRYGTTASNLTNYNQGQQLLFGLNLAHQLTRRIALSGFFNYQNNYYNQPDSVVNGVNVAPDFYDNVFNTGINMSFQINRVWSLLAGYTFTTLVSTSSQEKDYNQNIVFIGAEIDL